MGAGECVAIGDELRFIRSEPAPNALAGSEEIRVTFNQLIKRGTPETFVVRSDVLGRLTGRYGVRDTILSFAPEPAARGGARLQVSLTGALEGLSGFLPSPYVFGFRNRSSPSGATLIPIGSALPPAGEPVTRVAAADLDRNGRLEVLATVRSAVAVFRLTERGLVDGAPTTFASNVRDFVLADFDDDDQLDVFVAGAEAGQHRLFLSDGQGRFLSQPTFVLPDGIDRVVGADLDGDGDTDLAGVVRRSAQTEQGAVFVARNAGNGTFLEPEPLASGDSGPVGACDIAVADMNGDGVSDLVVLNDGQDGEPGSVSVLAQTDGAFGALASPVSTSAAVGAMTVGDFDGDGDLDVAVALRDLSVGVLENDGQGHLRLGTTSSAALADRLDAADMDGDGDLDIVTNAVTVLENDGDAAASFTERSPAPAGDAFALADVDRDGDVDVIIALESGIRVLRND